MTLCWNATKEDFLLIHAIVQRAQTIYPTLNKLQLMMDIEAAHAACPLQLRELLEADRSNFLHDVNGITQHINRETGKLEDCFTPRHAR